LGQGDGSSVPNHPTKKLAKTHSINYNTTRKTNVNKGEHTWKLQKSAA